MKLHDAVRSNLEALRSEGTLTITTGHQLCLFTGPLFFPLKVINTVAIAARLQRELKGTRVVPVFWIPIDHVLMSKGWHVEDAQVGLAVPQHHGLVPDDLHGEGRVTVVAGPREDDDPDAAPGGLGPRRRGGRRCR